MDYIFSYKRRGEERRGEERSGEERREEERRKVMGHNELFQRALRGRGL